jgi:hypothetical protein
MLSCITDRGSYFLYQDKKIVTKESQISESLKMYTQLINVREARRSYQYWVHTTQGEVKNTTRKAEKISNTDPT